MNITSGNIRLAHRSPLITIVSWGKMALQYWFTTMWQYCFVLYNVILSSSYYNTKYIYLACTMHDDLWMVLGWLFRQITLLRNVMPPVAWKYELCIWCLSIDFVVCLTLEIGELNLWYQVQVFNTPNICLSLHTCCGHKLVHEMSVSTANQFILKK